MNLRVQALHRWQVPTGGFVSPSLATWKTKRRRVAAGRSARRCIRASSPPSPVDRCCIRAVCVLVARRHARSPVLYTRRAPAVARCFWSERGGAACAQRGMRAARCDSRAAAGHQRSACSGNEQSDSARSPIKNSTLRPLKRFSWGLDLKDPLPNCPQDDSANDVEYKIISLYFNRFPFYSLFYYLFYYLLYL